MLFFTVMSVMSLTSIFNISMNHGREGVGNNNFTKGGRTQ